MFSLGTIKQLIKTYIPRRIYLCIYNLCCTKSKRSLTRLQKLAYSTTRNCSGKITIDGFKILYVDLLSLYMEYKDIFVHRIYHFEARNTVPYIIDGGACIGMSALYFKSVYPQATIVSFEPDENIYKVLQSNITANNLVNVELIMAGLAAKAGTVSFNADGSDGGKITDGNEGMTTIQTVRLSDYLDCEVDFLKLNIEGQELPVLEEVAASGRLSSVREMVLEYHGWAGGEQRLGKILTLLDQNGFKYLIHDFDSETNGATKPPFHFTQKTTWFCLVYAKRNDV